MSEEIPDRKQWEIQLFINGEWVDFDTNETLRGAELCVPVIKQFHDGIPLRVLEQTISSKVAEG